MLAQASAGRVHGGHEHLQGESNLKFLDAVLLQRRHIYVPAFFRCLPGFPAPCAKPVRASVHDPAGACSEICADAGFASARWIMN